VPNPSLFADQVSLQSRAKSLERAAMNSL